MPRKNLIRSNVHPYHLTARVNNREEFPCGVKFAWEIFCHHLIEIEQLFEVKIHAFVVMPNHFHLIMTSPYCDLDIVMHKLMSSLSKAINSKTGRTGRIFGGRYHWSMVTSLRHFDYVQKYVYRNPVKAQIVTHVEDYPYSSLRSVLQKEKIAVKLTPVDGALSLIPLGKKDEFLMWLNQPFRNEEYDSIKKGLRQTTFINKFELLK